MTHERFAIYYTAPATELAARGAGWLGYDIATGDLCEQPEGLSELTDTPSRYGFHATLKPPFYLADGQSLADLARAARTLTLALPAFELPALHVSGLGRFLALTTTDTPALHALAAACVQELDSFRAPPSDAELARRRSKGLTDRQEALLARWGYPYVLDEFRFHMTLTDRLDPATRDAVGKRAVAHLGSTLGVPHLVSAVTLCGERADGRFQALEVLPLRG